jgi:uncharacterized protein YyaL (SSP411 family)
MLYDNGQLVSLYSDAYLATNKHLYKEVVFETLEYIKQEMTNSEGAFYSSLDADSKDENGELEEGAYYTYTKEELEKLIGGDFNLFSEYYNVNDFGKWEEENNYVLIKTKADTEILNEYGLTAEAFQKKKTKWKKNLLKYRNKRDRPRLDDKTLTSWNALMLQGYIDAYKAFGTSEHLEIALKNANFIKDKQLQQNGALYHSYKEGKSTINGYL